MCQSHLIRFQQCSHTCQQHDRPCATYLSSRNRLLESPRLTTDLIVDESLFRYLCPSTASNLASPFPTKNPDSASPAWLGNGSPLWRLSATS